MKFNNIQVGVDIVFNDDEITHRNQGNREGRVTSFYASRGQVTVYQVTLDSGTTDYSVWADEIVGIVKEDALNTQWLKQPVRVDAGPRSQS